MKTFVFRNSTVEFLFSKNSDVHFSDYDGFSTDNFDYELFIWFYTLPIKQNKDVLVKEIEDFRIRLEMVTSQIPSDKTMILFTLKSIGLLNYENANWKLKYVIQDFNNFLSQKSDENANIKVLDLDLFLDEYPNNEMIDWRYFFLSKAVINPKLSNDFHNWFEKEVNSILQKRKKCLVLDLDNTLWGGILGEDGVEGIKLNDNYPGNAFKGFQEAIYELKKGGIILAICSKNNIKDVEELFASHDQMILKKEDFVIIKANWEDKASNISDIAQELNIGLDSLVFIDDNPSERELVKSMLPMVSVPDFPDKPYKLIDFIYDVYQRYFYVYELTNEDRNKTMQYSSNIKRDSFKKEFVSFESYIKNLNIELDLIQISNINVARFAQLTQKTNQFNLTTKRYSDTNLLNFHEQGDLVLGLNVKDKFGDSGISGLAIVKFLEEEIAEIDTFLMSCRVLGKRIENELLNAILDKLNKQGIKEVYSTYVCSKKNKQVENFYENNGFFLTNHSETEKKYNLKLSDKSIERNSIYRLNDY